MNQKENSESVEHPSLLHSESPSDRSLPNARILSSLDASLSGRPLRRFKHLALGCTAAASVVAGLAWAAWGSSSHSVMSAVQLNMPAIDRTGSPTAQPDPILKDGHKVPIAPEVAFAKLAVTAEAQQQGVPSETGRADEPDTLSSPFVVPDTKTGQKNQDDRASQTPDGVSLLAAPAGMSAALTNSQRKVKPPAVSGSLGKAETIQKAGSPSAGKALASRQGAKRHQRSPKQVVRRMLAKPSKSMKSGSRVAMATKAAKGAQAAKEGKSRPAFTKTQPSRKDADRDVQLLSAVVAHADSRIEANPSWNRQRVLSMSSGVALPTGDRQDKSLGSRNRDIVERSTNEATHDLLQRCRRLGLVEGEFCRWRICSGVWETDHACRIVRTDASH